MNRTRKIHYQLKRKYYVFLLGFLGWISLCFFPACRGPQSEISGLHTARAEGLSGNRPVKESSLPGKKQTQRGKDKHQPQNPYTPERMIHPVAYGTVPADYKPVVVPQE
jgi:hypothetical protein